MIRIAFIHNRFPAGGAERITVDIARYLHETGGYEVFVYATRLAQDLLPDDAGDIMTIRGIPSQAIPAIRTRKVESYISSDGIDILVQVTKAIPGISGIRARRGVKSVVSCHGEPFWQRHAIVYRRQKKRILWNLWNRRRFEDGTLAMKMAIERTYREYQNCDVYTVLCSPYKVVTAEALGIIPEKSHIYVIENPERPVADVRYEKDRMFLFCGRFENWSKRIDRLLRIWAKIQARLPEWKLVLVGDGPDAPMLRQMAEELALERIYFEGMQRNVEEYYRKASVVCLTSDTEGWPLALSEAQAHGCIGVAFGATSGIIEILSPEEGCGFVVSPFDEDSYADTLLEIASKSEEQIMTIRRNAVRKRLQYAPEIIAEKWRVLFDEIMKK